MVGGDVNFGVKRTVLVAACTLTETIGRKNLRRKVTINREKFAVVLVQVRQHQIGVIATQAKPHLYCRRVGVFRVRVCSSCKIGGSRRPSRSHLWS